MSTPPKAWGTAVCAALQVQAVPLRACAARLRVCTAPRVQAVPLKARP